jgi:hypothetical protein
MTYHQFDTYSLSPARTRKHGLNETRSAANPPSVIVSIRRDLEPEAACRMLRRFIETLERDRPDPDRL